MNIDITIDSDEIETDDLIESLSERRLTDDEKKSIEEMLNKKSLLYRSVKIETLNDKMKLKLISDNFHKKTLEEFEAFFNA